MSAIWRGIGKTILEISLQKSVKKTEIIKRGVKKSEKKVPTYFMNGPCPVLLTFAHKAQNDELRWVQIAKFIAFECVL